MGFGIINVKPREASTKLVVLSSDADLHAFDNLSIAFEHAMIFERMNEVINAAQVWGR